MGWKTPELDQLGRVAVVADLPVAVEVPHYRIPRQNSALSLLLDVRLEQQHLVLPESPQLPPRVAVGYPQVSG